MNRTFLCIVVIAVTAASAAAAAEKLQTAAKLLEKRHYRETIDLLRQEAAEPGKQGEAALTLGTAYYRSAVLHRELHRAATAAAVDYLKMLASAPLRDRSRFVDLYLGDAFLEAGTLAAAAAQYEKFLAGDAGEARDILIAKARLGLCRYRAGSREQADSLWAEIDAGDPAVRAELAAVYAAAGRSGKDAAELIEESLAAARKSGADASQRMLVNALSVCAKSGPVDACLDLLQTIDVRSASHREALGRSKVLHFYDPALLGDMAVLHGRAGIQSLEKAAKDPKLKDAAAFSLAQAQAVFGSPDQAAKIMSGLIASSSVPEQYKDRIKVWQAAVQYQKTRSAAAALSSWEDLIRKRPDDPELSAEVLDACSRLRLECPGILQRSAAAADAGEGKKYRAVNSAVGRYLLAGKDSARALAHLEAGRDKSNKNKIEANDPVMLVNLADAYIRNKKFSEALEIYFEMSKQFPEVRQIQDAVQGIYAVEQKSAGDVKIN